MNSRQRWRLWQARSCDTRKFDAVYYVLNTFLCGCESSCKGVTYFDQETLEKFSLYLKTILEGMNLGCCWPRMLDECFSLISAFKVKCLPHWAIQEIGSKALCYRRQVNWRNWFPWFLWYSCPCCKLNHGLVDVDILNFGRLYCILCPGSFNRDVFWIPSL